MKLNTLLICILYSINLHAQYQLIWSDEFNGSSLDANKWTAEIGQGNWGWGNNELQYYTSSTTNLLLDTGYLHIVALQEQIGAANYSSARIKTEGKFDFQYGMVEARIKVPMGQGLWPACWMLGANISTVSWPMCGEIDIMEHINNEMLIHGTHHYDNNGHVYQGDTIGTNPADFHIYAIEWTSDSIHWMLDGQTYFSTNINSAAKSEFHAPFFLLLNMAVGGNWPGSPNASTSFPATMLVDYIRVYQDSSQSNDLNITVDLCNQSANSVRMVGPDWNNWDPNSGPAGNDNGDGTWTFNLSPAPSNPMQYLISVDGVYENLINDMQDAGGCAPITDYWSYANRLWNPADGLNIDIYHDRCVPCSYPKVDITVAFCDTTGLNTAKLVSAYHGWNYNIGKNGINNGDGTWTFTYDPIPMDSLQFVIYRDGVAENLIDDMQQGGNCAPITDYASYANRLWTFQDSSNYSITFDSCNTCQAAQALSINQSYTQAPQCFGDANGSIFVQLQGGNTPYNYQWSHGTNNTDSLQNLAAGTYYLTATDASGATIVDTFQLNNPLPLQLNIITVDTSNCGTCQGIATAAVSNGIAPISYIWNTGASSAQVNGLCAGSYTVSITDNNGCSTDSNVQIISGDIPASSISCATSNCIVCDSQYIQLNASGNYANYDWSNGQSGTSIQVNTANNYMVTVTDSLGCSTISSITVPAFNSPADTAFQYSSSGLTFNFNTSAGYDYQWYFGDGDSASVQNPSHSYANPGQYTVLLVLSNACGTDSLMTIVDASIVSSTAWISNKNTISIYPQPFDNFCTIQFDNPNHQKHDFQLFNSKGQLVRTKRTISKSSFRIYKKNLASGLYHFHLTGPEYHYKGTIIIQ